jgi:hypothetical protein
MFLTLFFLLPLKLTFCRLPRAEKLIIWSILFLFFFPFDRPIIVVVVVVLVICVIVAVVVADN